MFDSRLAYNTPVFMTLCCQHCINTGKMVDARTVMRWMRVTKPTAIKALDEYAERGYLEKFSRKWRSNSKVYYYRPIKSVFTAYRRGEYREAFRIAAYSQSK